MTFFFINLNFRGTRPTVSISGFQVSTCSVEHGNSVGYLYFFVSEIMAWRTFVSRCKLLLNDCTRRLLMDDVGPAVLQQIATR